MNLLARVIYLIGGFIVTILGIRLLLVLLGANASNGFVSFIYNMSAPFVRPFFGMFNYAPSFGTAQFEFATLVAIVVYAIATYLLVSILSPSRHYTV